MAESEYKTRAEDIPIVAATLTAAIVGTHTTPIGAEEVLILYRKVAKALFATSLSRTRPRALHFPLPRRCALALEFLVRLVRRREGAAQAALHPLGDFRFRQIA